MKWGFNYHAHDQKEIFTDGTLIRAEEGPKVLHAPPTAHMVPSISTLAVAVNTIGGYNWRHCGDFTDIHSTVP